MRLSLLVLLSLFLGCGEQAVGIYSTDCPRLELKESVGYLSIEGVDSRGFAYWACVGEDCSGEYTRPYGISVSQIGDNTLRVCCGSKSSRVDLVKIVIIKE